jgi:DNA gyrase/topoisomerase IV subunit A
MTNVIIEEPEELNKPEKIVASKLIEENTKEYGAHTVDFLFPSPIDGLKTVHRRILWTLQNVSGNDNEIAGNSLVGDVIKIHPYGDNSTYEAIVRLSQPFKLSHPLIDIIGDCGTYGGDKYAAARYVSFVMSEFAKDLFFTGIDKKCYKMIAGEYLSTLEPEYLIPKLPYALLSSNSTPGFGTKSLTSAYSIEGIVKLVMEYSLHHEKFGEVVPWDYSNLTRHLIPHSPIYGYLRNQEYLQHEMSKNNNFEARIVTDGTMSVYQDYIDIHTLPIGLGIDRCKEDVLTEMKKKGSYFDQNLIDYNSLSDSKLTAVLRFKFKRGIDIFDAIDEVKRVVKFTGYITPINNYSTKGIVIRLTPIQLLKYWYRERYNSILAKKKYQQMSYSKRLQELELRLMVCHEIDKVIKIIRHNELNEGIRLLREEFSLSPHQAHILINIPLSTLAKSSKIELEMAHASIKEENNTLLNSYNHVNREIYEEVEELGKKYKTSGGLYVPKYKGYLKIGEQGIYQYESDKDLISMIDRFNGKKVVINQYKKNDNYFNLIAANNVKNHGMVPDCILPKILKGRCILHTSKVRNIKTIFIHDKCVAYIDKLLLTPDPNIDLYHVGENILTISSKGIVNRCHISDLSEKKSICRGPQSDIIYACNNVVDNLVVISMNTSISNQLRLQLITPKDKKIIITPTGETKILGVFNTNEYNEIDITLHEDCLSRTRVSHVRITKPLELFTSEKYITFDVNRSTVLKRKVKRLNINKTFISI